jgi:hypothetical protein
VTNKLALSDREKVAWDKIKQMLCDVTELSAPNYDMPYAMFCDASDRAVGACLTQEDGNGAFKPIAFASSKLTPTQERWTVSERESYAVIFGLRTFDYLVFGNNITIFTDNVALKYVQQNSTNSPKLFRWGLTLARHSVTVKHLPGVSNPVADLLSRIET